MASQKRPNHRDRVRRPAESVDALENQVIADAVRLAQQQIRDGTASSQTLGHYLKLGSTRERLEQERLGRENLLLQAKVDALASAKNVEELYASALRAMQTYSGQDDEEYDDYS